LRDTIFLLFQSAAALSWAKEKSEAFTLKFLEVVEMYNNLSGQYNDLKKEAETRDTENARLKKKVEDLEALISAREKELKDAQYRADSYEEKSTSIKLFTTVKVRAKKTKEFSEGKATDWDPAAAASAWEEIKLLYSDSEGEEEYKTEDASPSQHSPRGTQVVAAELGVGVVLEELVK